MLPRYLKSQKEFHPSVNAPLPGYKCIQMTPLDLSNTLIRQRLRQVWTYGPNKTSQSVALEWLRDIAREYIRIQPVQIRATINSWTATNRLRYIQHQMVYALQDMTGAVVNGGGASHLHTRHSRRPYSRSYVRESATS